MHQPNANRPPMTDQVARRQICQPTKLHSNRPFTVLPPALSGPPGPIQDADFARRRFLITLNVRLSTNGSRPVKTTIDGCRRIV
jgi:hypothetical protein